MADNFDIVEEALRLLAPKRYKSGGTVRHFDAGGSILDDTPFGYSVGAPSSSEPALQGLSSDSGSSYTNFTNFNPSAGPFGISSPNLYGQALASDSGMSSTSGLGDIVPVIPTVGGPMGWGSIGIGALDARLWGMFAPESGSMSSEFSTYIMGLIIERALAGLASNVQWTDAEIGAFQQRIVAEVSGYIDRNDIYHLIAEDPFNPEFVEYVMEKKGELMGIKPEALATMVSAANAAAASQAASQQKGVLATAKEKAQAAIDIVEGAMQGASDFIDDKLSGVHEVVDKIYGKGQEFIDDIWRHVPEPIRNVWPNAGIVYNTTTGSVTGTWVFGTGSPPSLPGGSPGIVIGHVNPAGGWVTPRRSSPLIITTGSAIKDKLINVLLGKGKIDPATILQEVLDKVVEMTGIPESILKGSPNLKDIIETIVKAIQDKVLTANVTFLMTSGCVNTFSCPENYTPKEDCSGCECNVTCSDGTTPLNCDEANCPEEVACTKTCWDDSTPRDCDEANCPDNPRDLCLTVWCTAEDELVEGCYPDGTDCNPQATCPGVWCTADDERGEGCFAAGTDCNPQVNCDGQWCTADDERGEGCFAAGTDCNPQVNCDGQWCTADDERGEGCFAAGTDCNPQANCPDVWCTAADELAEGCYGTDTNCNPDAFATKCADKQTECEANGKVASTDCDTCVDPPVDPALQACLDQGCEGIDDAGVCTECPLTPLEECIQYQNCKGYDEGKNECTGCECPDACPDPENQTQASFEDGCGCTDKPIEECDPDDCDSETQTQNEYPDCGCVDIDPPVDPALQACLDQGCEGIDDAGVCTECPLTPLEECQNQDCTGYDEATDLCTGCECPDSCPDPDNQTQASFVDGCGCTNDDPCADKSCDEGYEPEPDGVGGCDCVEIIITDPCADKSCDEGYEPEPDGVGGCDCVEIIITDPCADKSCDEGYEPEPDGVGGCDCVEIIITDPCADKSCDEGYEPEPDGVGGCDCVEIIITDPCADKSCDEGYEPEPDGVGGCDCVEIIITDPCADKSCDEGYEPEPDGVGGCDCVEVIITDPCADKSCDEGYEPEPDGVGGCDCVEIIITDPCADKSCDEGYEPEPDGVGGCDCVPIDPCESVEYAFANPCECQEGYAAAHSAECDPVPPGECTNEQQAVCPGEQLTGYPDCACPAIPGECTPEQQAVCPDEQLTGYPECACPEVPPGECTNEQQAVCPGEQLTGYPDCACPAIPGECTPEQQAVCPDEQLTGYPECACPEVPPGECTNEQQAVCPGEQLTGYPDCACPAIPGECTPEQQAVCPDEQLTGYPECACPEVPPGECTNEQQAVCPDEQLTGYPDCACPAIPGECTPEQQAVCPDEQLTGYPECACPEVPPGECTNEQQAVCPGERLTDYPECACPEVPPTPCEELEGECAKIEKCADCDPAIMQCVECSDVPPGCTQQQIDDCWTELTTDCKCAPEPGTCEELEGECAKIGKCADCDPAIMQCAECPDEPPGCTQQQIDDCWTEVYYPDCRCPPETPCEELEGECAKLGKCADCDTFQCVVCGGGCTAAAQALCPEAQLDANCNCPTTPIPPTPTSSPRGFFPTALPGSSRRTVTSDPPELVDIDYLYDIGGKSIFPENIDDFLNPDTDDTEPTSFSSYTPYNRGGIVQDRLIETLVDILRSK